MTTKKVSYFTKIPLVMLVILGFLSFYHHLIVLTQWPPARRPWGSGGRWIREALPSASSERHLVIGGQRWSTVHRWSDGEHIGFPWDDLGITRPGKLTESYGKSPFLMGKSTISMAMFNSKLLVYQRVFLWDDVGWCGMRSGNLNNSSHIQMLISIENADFISFLHRWWYNG